MFYTRTNRAVCWLLPCAAIGHDESGTLFFEVAWLLWVIGVGEKE